MSYTDGNGIARIEDSDPIKPLQGLFNLVASTASDAVTDLRKRVIYTVENRAAADTKIANLAGQGIVGSKDTPLYFQIRDENLMYTWDNEQYYPVNGTASILACGSYRISDTWQYEQWKWRDVYYAKPLIRVPQAVFIQELVEDGSPWAYPISVQISSDQNVAKKQFGCYIGNKRGATVTGYVTIRYVAIG